MKKLYEYAEILRFQGKRIRPLAEGGQLTPFDASAVVQGRLAGKYPDDIGLLEVLPGQALSDCVFPGMGNPCGASGPGFDSKYIIRNRDLLMVWRGGMGTIGTTLLVVEAGGNQIPGRHLYIIRAREDVDSFILYWSLKIRRKDVAALVDPKFNIIGIEALRDFELDLVEDSPGLTDYSDQITTNALKAYNLLCENKAISDEALEILAKGGQLPHNPMINLAPDNRSAWEDYMDQGGNEPFEEY